MKKPRSAGGRGQRTVTTADELQDVLDAFSPDDLALCGLVLEVQLAPVATLSAGQITVGGIVVTYYGTQKLATDNAGRSVYGGSDLICVRGGWEKLERIQMPGNARLAVKQARYYDECMEAYPAFLASRRNYDIGQGVDPNGEWRSGVFEASWRVGGASTAELGAVTAFVRDPTLQVVEASVVKAFGTDRKIPADAVVHYEGDDPEDGPIIRYVLVTRRSASCL